MFMIKVAKERGYTNTLAVLPFDHRGSFEKSIFGIQGTPTRREKNEIKKTKYIIYKGFQEAIHQGIPKSDAAILVDDQYAKEVIHHATKNGIIVALATEKSGQKMFDFDHGDQFREQVDKLHPTFVKALVRYNPAELESSQQLTKLKELSDFADANGYKFLI